jgi:hypothetical protein
MRYTHFRLPVGAIALLMACRSPTDAPPTPLDVRQWVTGEAALAVTSNGHFILPPPAESGEEAITSTEVAKTLGEGFIQLIRESAPPPGSVSFQEQLNYQRGAPIRFDELVVAERAFFAESAYPPLPDSLGPAFRKNLGPFFLVPFLDRGDPAVVIASSAYNTDVKIEDGRLRFASQHGNDFWLAAIPVRTGYAMPVTPEAAVKVAWEATGARIDEVPRLILPHRRYFPQFARWRVSLERPVRVQGLKSATIFQTDELYVGHSLGESPPVYDQLAAALPEQPRADTLLYPDPDAPDGRRSLVIEFRPDIPVQFEAVQVVE